MAAGSRSPPEDGSGMILACAPITGTDLHLSTTRMFSGPLPGEGQVSLEPPDFTAGFSHKQCALLLFPYPGNAIQLFWSSLWWQEAGTHLRHRPRARDSPGIKSALLSLVLGKGAGPLPLKFIFYSNSATLVHGRGGLATSVHRPEPLQFI